jgi:recombination protein RecT
MTDMQDDDRRQARREQRQAARNEGASEARALELERDRALGAIKSDAFWNDILEALPRTINNEWFRSVAMAAIMTDPKLLQADRRSLANALVFSARMGLIPGPGYNEIALFVDGRGMVQHRTMYQGILKLIRNSGLVSDIDAQTLYENDHCALRIGEFPNHEIPLDRERGKPRGCYAYALPKGATKWMIEYMSWSSIMAHAKRYSEALRQNRDTPWKDPEAQGEMGNKTVLLRLAKMLPKSPEVMEALAHEEELERAERARDVTGAATPALMPPERTTAHGWTRQFGNGAETQREEPSRSAAGAPGEAKPREEAQPRPEARPTSSEPSAAQETGKRKRSGRAITDDIIAALGRAQDDDERSGILAEASRYTSLTPEMREEIRRAATKEPPDDWGQGGAPGGQHEQVSADSVSGAKGGEGQPDAGYGNGGEGNPDPGPYYPLKDPATYADLGRLPPGEFLDNAQRFAEEPLTFDQMNRLYTMTAAPLTEISKLGIADVSAAAHRLLVYINQRREALRPS